jgi:hypothetical protein
MDMNEIYISKSNKVLVANGDSKNTNQLLAASVVRNMEAVGYTVSKALFERLSTLDENQIKVFHTNVIQTLRKAVGAHKKFSPMYPNFPQQVMEASDLELFFNAIIHYWSLALPASEEQVREPLLVNKVPLKVLDLGTQSDFDSIFTRLVAANTSISENDKEIVKWFVSEYGNDIVRLIPEKIPQKEQLALLTNELRSNKIGIESVKKYVKTATDVLRIATAMSDGDISLAANTKYAKFGRPDRRFLLELLESAGNSIAEDLLRHDTKWIKLGEVLHPGEYRRQYPKVWAAFDNLRNDRKIRTFNSRVETKLVTGTGWSIAEFLKERPGDFARRLDHVFRKSEGFGELNLVANKFISVADKVATPVLLQVFNHFKNREIFEGPRAIFPKGQLAKIQVLENPLPSLYTGFPAQFAASLRDVLVERFSKMEPLGSVYLDDKLKNYIVPFSQRSASKSLRTISRGSKIDLPDGNFLRFFLWWKDGTSRTDIDLSASMYSSDWKPVQDITYYNLRGLNCYHSGDITSAPKGASEFIDIDMNKLIQNKARYVLMIINSFTQQPYCDLPECFAGWMARTATQSGEIYEPATVVDKVDVTSDTTVCVPVIFDLVGRQAIWTDLGLKSRNWINNVASNKGNIQKLGSAMCNLNKPCLYDLLEMHAVARGQLVKDKNAADRVFAEHEGLTPWDGDKIISEYLV